MGARSGVARARAKARGSAAKAGTTPAIVTESAANSELDVDVDVTIDVEGGPAAEDLVDVEGEVEEILVDVGETAVSSDPDAEDVVWDEEQSQVLRQARKDAELSASADSLRAYLKQIGKVALLNAEQR